MGKYRGKRCHREVHPKIFVWSHTVKAEIEYFQDFKNYLCSPLLVPKKEICGTPQELLAKIIQWKDKNICEEDSDQVWCIFDVDDFYRNNKEELVKVINNAVKNNIKIAYANECFELWILLHFQGLTAAVGRGKSIKEKIEKGFKKYKLGLFKKNRKVFNILLPFQGDAIKNAKNILLKYSSIDWNKRLSEKGNPSTSIHFLVNEINTLIGKGGVK